MRHFESGATRNNSDDKLDYEGFLSPLVLERYAQFLHKNRTQDDGSLRASDNWQKGIPITEYMKSLWRHFMAVWKHVRGLGAEESFEEALCAVIFNASGMLHERLRSARGLQLDELKRRYPELFIEPISEEALDAPSIVTSEHAASDHCYGYSPVPDVQNSDSVLTTL